MRPPQSGIFALGTSSYAYLELDLKSGAAARDLVTAMANLREPRMTVGGINLVSGFRPELWRPLVPDDTPAELTGFNQPVRGRDGYTMPATQHDAVLWLSGSAYDIVFDEALGAIATLAPVATVADETSGWVYERDRDLTGFIDGTKNPSLLEAAEDVVIPSGRPGAGGSILLLQKWEHDVTRWTALPVAEQEQVMGRRKPDSVELDPQNPTSHVARTDQDKFGKVFRRNTPYGTVTRHGTMFVGFAVDQQRLAQMLDSMAGVDGVRDELTRYTRPLTGAYYFVPSLDAIARFSTLPPDD